MPEALLDGENPMPEGCSSGEEILSECLFCRWA